MHITWDPIVISAGSFAVATISLLVSGTHFWFTAVRRGKLRMTRPSLVVFKHDNLGREEVLPKIFVRTLLYSTGNRGHVLQVMYLKIQHGEMVQNFSVWGHGAQNDLKYGAGLKVGPDGIDHNHHFNPPKNAKFEYTAGNYLIDVFAELADSGERVQLGRTSLIVTEEQAEKLRSPETEVHFEWGPDSKAYQAHVYSRPERLGVDEMLKLMAPPQETK